MAPYSQLQTRLQAAPHTWLVTGVYRDFRAGDVRHSLADIGKAATRLGYAPTPHIAEGLESAMPWYFAQK